MQEACGCCLHGFSKAFDTFSHSILLEELASHGMGDYTLLWVKTDSMAWSTVLVNGLRSAGRAGLSVEDSSVEHLY